jgi:hypothetical protein
MKLSAVLRAAIVALPLAIGAVGPAVASTEFLVYEGRNAIKEGEGGNKKVVDGVDFWVNGSPPHRFQILGALVDERWATGLYGMMRVANLQHDIAKRARAAGGDAVILEDSHNSVWGVSSSTFGSANVSGNSVYGSSFSTASPYGTHNSRYIVVKYLPDASASPTAAVPPPGLLGDAPTPPTAAAPAAAPPSAEPGQPPAKP